MTKYKERSPIEMECKVCGSVFTAYSKRAKYCSCSCSSKSYWIKNRDSVALCLRKRVQASRSRAIAKGIDFDLDYEYLYNLYEEQNGQCALSEDYFDFSIPEEYVVNPKALSLDRIVPEKGYTRGNVRLVTYQVNIALGEYGEEALLELATKLIGVLR